MGMTLRSGAILVLVAAAEFALVSRTVADDKLPLWQVGQIIKITTEPRAESGTGGPQPPKQEDGAPPPVSGPDYSVVTYVRLRGSGLSYTGRLAVGVDPMELAEFVPGKPVKFRLSDGKMYLLRSNGADVELTLIRN